MTSALDNAKRLLVHYFRLAGIEVDRDRDLRVEIESIVDEIATGVLKAVRDGAEPCIKHGAYPCSTCLVP
jgi:hypothetical protein